MGMDMAVIAMEDADVVVSEEGRTTCISGCWAGKVVEERSPPGTTICVRGLTASCLCWCWVYVCLHRSMHLDTAASVSSIDGYTRRKPAALIRT